MYIAIYCSLCYGCYCLGNYYCEGILAFIICPHMCVLFLMCILYGANGTPFDYVQSESGCIGGFNSECSGIFLTCLFACESTMIFLYVWLGSVVMVGGGMSGFFLLFLNTLLFFGLVLLSLVSIIIVLLIFWSMALSTFGCGDFFGYNTTYFELLYVYIDCSM